MEQNVNGMKLFGYLALVGGLALFGYAFFMDVTVPSPLGRVVNIHLMSQQKNYQMAGMFASFLGIVMLVVGGKQKPAETSSSTAEPSGLDRDINPLNKMGPQGRQVFALVIGSILFLCLLVIYKSAT